MCDVGVVGRLTVDTGLCIYHTKEKSSTAGWKTV